MASFLPSIRLTAAICELSRLESSMVGHLLKISTSASGERPTAVPKPSSWLNLFCDNAFNAIFGCFWTKDGAWIILFRSIKCSARGRLRMLEISTEKSNITYLSVISFCKATSMCLLASKYPNRDSIMTYSSVGSNSASWGVAQKMSICGGLAPTNVRGRAATTAILQILLNLSLTGLRATMVPCWRRLDWDQWIRFPARSVENSMRAAAPIWAKVYPTIKTYF